MKIIFKAQNFFLKFVLIFSPSRPTLSFVGKCGRFIWNMLRFRTYFLSKSSRSNFCLSRSSLFIVFSLIYISVSTFIFLSIMVERTSKWKMKPQRHARVKTFDTPKSSLNIREPFSGWWYLKSKIFFISRLRGRMFWHKNLWTLWLLLPSSYKLLVSDWEF